MALAKTQYDYIRVAGFGSVIREKALRMMSASGSGHPGGAFSCADILASLFFSGCVRYHKDDPTWEGRDRFVLSKGHAAPALYAVMNLLGWVKDSELETLRTLGSRLQGHPDSKLLPGVEVCTGSLGQGLSVGVGMALGLRLQDGKENPSCRRVFVLCGDGELQEGSNWEALMCAAHRKLGNLVLLIDLNGLQIDGTTDEVCSLGDLLIKLEAFGWEVQEVNGHDCNEIQEAIMQTKYNFDTPHAIVCHTIKGMGVSFMEGKREWHGKVPSGELMERAFRELHGADEGYCSKGVMLHG